MKIRPLQTNDEKDLRWLLSQQHNFPLSKNNWRIHYILNISTDGGYFRLTYYKQIKIGVYELDWKDFDYDELFNKPIREIIRCYENICKSTD